MTTKKKKTVKKLDKYDKAIAYLKKNPDHIRSAWDMPSLHQAGCLFQAVSLNGKLLEKNKAGDHYCGCLTQVAYEDTVAYTDELATEIRKDERIPVSAGTITVESLSVFAEWQRRIDKELKRK